MQASITGPASTRRSSGRVAQRHAQLQTADEERHQHGDFGEVLHPAGDVQEFHFPQADAELADQQAEARRSARW